MKIKYLILVLIIVGISIFVGLNSKFLKKEEPPIHIALVGPITGKSPSNGEAHLHGVSLYVDEINRAGGIDGKKIVIDIYDDENDDALAEKKALEAVNSQSVAVIGHNYSSCSISGGKIYKQYEIPAISPSSTDAPVTIGNEWYFRTIYNNNIQGKFLAHYAQKLLKQRAAHIIYEDLSYGKSLAEVFEKTWTDAELEIKSKMMLLTRSEESINEAISQIVENLKKDESQSVIFLSTHAPEAIKFVKAMKDAGLKNLILAPNALASLEFQNGFDSFPKEKLMPGFYTDGIYVTTPMIFDSAGKLAQKFKEDYNGKYKKDPDWRAVFAYDAAMLIVEAIKQEKIEGKPETIKSDRKKIRDFLASLNNVEDAIEGTTGFNYFDENGDPEKVVSIGFYKNKMVISALTQLQIVRNLNEIISLEEAIKSEKVLIIDDKYMYKTNVVYTGFHLNEISNLNLNDMTYSLDFFLWFRFPGNLKMWELEFTNAADPIRLEKTVINKISEGIAYHLYHIKGVFKTDYLEGQYSYGRRTLGVSFRHRDLDSHNLIFVSDSLGMGLTDDRYSERKKNAKLLNPATGWIIDQIYFYQNVLKKSSLGDVEYVYGRGNNIDFSQFNMKVQIRKNELGFRRNMSLYSSQYTLYICLILMIILFILNKLKLKKIFKKTIWITQSIIVFIILLSSEIVLSSLLSGKVEVYYMEAFYLTFDILWWLSSAIVLIILFEKFLWTPLEERTGQHIPNNVRQFVGFTILMLSIFGIIAFVFDQRITGLLATSGLIAMIVGLAIQINISNIFAGIVLNIERPFRIGDWVKIGNYNDGIVTDITWRATKLNVMNSIVSVPNSAAAESFVLNYSYPTDIYWKGFTVHIDPIHSPNRVQKLLLDAVLSVKDILTPWIVFDGINDWSASYLVYFKVRDYGKRYVYIDGVWRRVWVHLNWAGINFSVNPYTEKKERDEYIAPFDNNNPIDVLNHTDLFVLLSEDQRINLSKKMKAERFSKGGSIPTYKDSELYLYIVTEGVVGEWIIDNGKQIETQRFGSGDIFGGNLNIKELEQGNKITAISDVILFKMQMKDIDVLTKDSKEFDKLLTKKLKTIVVPTEKKDKVVNEDTLIKNPSNKDVKGVSKISRFFAFRKAERIPIKRDVPIDLKVKRESGKTVNSILEEITIDGLSFSCDSLKTKIKKGESLIIEIRTNLVADSLIQINCLLQHYHSMVSDSSSKKSIEKYGVQFIDLEEETVKKIKMLIKALYN
ncbi:MAG: ABC transporter substrate-binding protein [Desulfobacterales bacterium]|nr:ABC transporter substrate-binding protein [Desulfobacterales bacterium]